MKHALKLSAIYLAALGAALLVSGTDTAGAATLEAANDGVDSAACGSPKSPCRSISQAIENASDGDTIEVGAGRYGSISGSADFTGPGDEHPQQLGTRDAYSGCVVCITKALHIFSLHGAATTIIEGLASSQFSSTVLIHHDGVVFGREGGGFTLTGGNQNGLVIDQELLESSFGVVLQHNVVVAGNVDLGDQYGFVFNGLNYRDVQCPDPSCEATAQIMFSGNQATNNSGIGFLVTVGLFRGGPVTLRGNLASGGGTGFEVATGTQDQVNGADFAENVQLLGNVAIHNGAGFVADLPGQIVGNTAAGNSQFGFLITPGGAAFQDNSAIGNAGPGAIIQFSPDETNFGAIGHFQSFTNNNFYGNDRNRPALSLAPVMLLSAASYNPGPSAGCGVLNVGALAVILGPFAGGTLPIIILNAANNFWGSAQGPQAHGSADAVGGRCDQNAGVTLAKQFAPVPFAITSLP
jgi:hypothetical protein